MRCVLVLAIVGALGVPARADEDHAEADRLFELAQQLKQAGKLDEACTKYEEALAKNKNAVGLLLNVGKCAEDSGKVATAVEYYTQARDLAREHNLAEHRTAAEERLAVVGPRVPRLEVAFTEHIDGMKLVIDDQVYATDAKAIGEIRLDPGSRHVVVTAPGRVPYSTNVELVEGKQHAVAIPVLGRPVTIKVSKARRTVGQIMTFSGAAFALTGVVLGYKANVDYQAQVGGAGSGRNCIDEGSGPVCNAEGYKVTGQARDLGTVATVVGIAGLAVASAGIVLWWTAPSETVQQMSVVPTVTNDSAGIAAVGRF